MLYDLINVQVDHNGRTVIIAVGKQVIPGVTAVRVPRRNYFVIKLHTL